MKKLLSGGGYIPLGMAAIVIFPIILIFWLLHTTVDFIKYRISPYYKDTKEKYSWNVSLFNPYFIIYNIIKRENMPIEFYRDIENPVDCFGYFVYDNSLILPDSGFVYAAKTGIWYCENEKENENSDNNVTAQSIVNKETKRCNKLIGESMCKYTYALLINCSVPENAPTEFENFRFVPVIKNNYKSALKSIIDY